MKVWVLTYEVNEYDQCGEYYIATFLNKPSSGQLHDLLEIDFEAYGEEYITHILSGGGRVKWEHTWFHLFEEELK